MNNAVEQFIISRKKEHQAILFALRNLIVNTAPVVEEIKWNIPMFSYKGLLCFINVHQNKQPLIAFTKGYLLSNQQGMLTATNRKFIRHLPVNNLDDFYLKENSIREVIQEAILLNEQKPYSDWKK